MLTDYHVHLRPDEPDTPPSRYFTMENIQRYRSAAQALGIAELGISEHLYRFSQALDVWRHPYWKEQARDDLDAYCEIVRSTPEVRLGIEADFVAGAEERLLELITSREWDYVIGSVHFVETAAVNMRGEWDIWSWNDPSRVWERYFATLGEAASSGLFDILAHPDLVKIWGSATPAPPGDLRRLYELALEGIAASGIAIEVSTAGLRKPAREMYPASDLLRLCIEAGSPVALSSDAHQPEQVGYQYGYAVEWLTQLGVTEIAVFENRNRSLVSLSGDVQALR